MVVSLEIFLDWNSDFALNPYLAKLNEFTFTRLARLLQGVMQPPGMKPINLSIGEPKHPTPPFICEAIGQNTDSLAQYPPTKGTAALRQAIASWVKQRFALPALDAETQVLPVVGTKEAIYSFTQTVIDPRAARPLVLVPNPFYMVYEAAATLCGATPYYVNFDPKRGEYMWRDLARLCAKFELPWRQPSQFPRASTLAARVACEVADETWGGDYIRRLFTANFGADQDIGDRTIVAEILTGLERDAAEVLARSESPERRGALRANTEKAIAIGIFGAPNCLVGDELFWGEEALEDAISWSLGDHPASRRASPKNKPPPSSG